MRLLSLRLITASITASALIASPGLGSGAPLADFFRVEVGRSSLNIRAAPSTNAEILIRLTTGSVVRNLGCAAAEGREWCAIEQPVHGGVRGWAASEFLRETAPPADAARIEPVVAGARLSSTGRIACAIEPAAPMTACEFGVVRGGGGNAMLVIQLPDGNQRTIRFDQGVPTSSDAGLIAARRSGDATLIAIGASERYEIPDSVVDDDSP